MSEHVCNGNSELWCTVVITVICFYLMFALGAIFGYYMGKKGE